MVPHIECLPDETLVKKLGFTNKEISHHAGKSRVYSFISKRPNQIAMVDEDPGQANHPYAKKLVFQREIHGINFYLDAEKNNRVFVLKVKLEDWIIATCKKSNTELSDFGLPSKPNELHDIINYRLAAFGRLLDVLIEENNEAILALKKMMKGH